MKSDIAIAHDTKLKHISDVAKKLALEPCDIDLYGNVKAKIKAKVWERIKDNATGKLILVTSINPTKAGEGKTTTSIGLSDAMNLLGYKTCLALREPSLGPCFGMKGGATGGGFAQVAPMEDINLHFTGDFHAITSANNLLAAMIDNHVYFGNKLNIDLSKIIWKRSLDMNDRALRKITIDIGKNNLIRDTGFDITVASELMAIFCLATDIHDLKKRIAKITVAYDTEGHPITCDDLHATGAITTLLKDAIQPNLVQTLEGNPAIIHGGPFANIAHGCNSVIATSYALRLSDYVVTEAGFGADLGAEKFIDIKCPILGKYPDAVVIVATIKALKLHGENLEQGFCNLAKHIENIKRYNLPVVVAINHFTEDTSDEIDLVKRKCAECGVRVAFSDVWSQGGLGGKELAQSVIESINENKQEFVPLYNRHDSLFTKVKNIAQNIYGAQDVVFSDAAQKIITFADQNYREYPVCMAKTQYSLSDNKDLMGRPQNFSITIRDAKLMTGAQFVVMYCGDILTMPGLPRIPAAEHIDIDDSGQIVGLS